jgi:hypothetical protein
MNTKRFTTVIILVLGLLLSMSVGLGTAHEAQDDPSPANPEALSASVGLMIPVQGQLTNLSGIPLHGNYNLTLSVYDVQTGGTPKCADSQLVSINNGLFNANVKGCTVEDIDGKQLYLGVEVESDGEMTPRQPLYPVPYAYSLVQGAISRGSLPFQPMFTAQNSNNLGGIGLDGFASSNNGVNYGVWGRSQSPQGYAGYFQNTGSGGVDIKAGGSGIIQSAAKSYLFVPGANLIKQYNTDTTEWIISGSSAAVTRGTDGGSKHILIPITIPAVLYGQSVRVTQITVYYSCPDAVDNHISNTQLFKNTDAESSDSLISSSDATKDQDSSTPDNYTYNTKSAHNLLSPDEGFLSLDLTLQFVADNERIIIGGVRLTLEHE